MLYFTNVLLRKPYKGVLSNKQLCLILFCCCRWVTEVSSVFHEEPLNPTSQAVRVF